MLKIGLLVIMLYFVMTLIIICSKLTIELQYRSTDRVLTMKAYLFGRIRLYTKDFSMKQITHKFWRKIFGKERYYKSLKHQLEHYKDSYTVLFQNSQIREFTWKTKIGTGDPASVAVLTGLVWSIKGLIINYIKKQVKTMERPPKVKVVPDFFKPYFETELHCIFRIGVGHIIIAGYRYLILKIKIHQTKRGNEKWLNTQSKGL